LFAHDLRANAFRVCREGKPLHTFPDHALEARNALWILYFEHDLLGKPSSTFPDHALMPEASPAPPARPQLAVSAVIFRDGKVLLVRRARSPAKDFYSLPGGRVEFGESLATALHREVREETGLEIEIIGLAGWREVLPGASGGGHYVIMSFATRWAAGEPALNEEHDDFKWLEPHEFGDLKLTGGLAKVVEAARRLL
jgi:8-oxo-dGTP diphosphatase